MLPNSSDSLSDTPQVSPQPSPDGAGEGSRVSTERLSLRRRVGFIVGLPLWTFLGFMLAQALVLAIAAVLQEFDVSFDTVNETVFNTAITGIVYGLAISIVLGVPLLIKRRPTTRKELGLHRLLRWRDIGLAPAGLIVYVILTQIVAAIAVLALPFVDYTQAQETGFTGLSSQLEYILAFASLVVIAPVAEEVLFRGYLFGKLRKYAPLWVSILITSLLFAFVHFQWNVALDVFALSIVLCVLRVASGSIWPAILLHMMKNGIAYYFLFINTSLTSTLGI